MPGPKVSTVIEIPLSPEGKETLEAVCARTGQQPSEAVTAAIALLALVTEHLEDPCGYVALRTPDRGEIVVDLTSIYHEQQAQERQRLREQQGHRYLRNLLDDLDLVRLSLLVHGNGLPVIATALTGMPDRIWNKVGNCVPEEMWLVFDGLRERAAQASADEIAAARKQLAEQIIANS